ncbi:peptidyl-prolyl cis-trans isomerase A1 [Drosophila novamexicana]|uniref:peptidyl-prolyl cis-trans isomerase A1 n=1 Tax=Drosophila novamexicana TaxID=47314 RepID=UPI0011E5E330|nr:peptidyl-prolyl cis-trans isomerase A1 [Drosophila novamexicana]
MLRQLSDVCDMVQQHVQQQLLQHAPTGRICHMRDLWLHARLQIQHEGNSCRSCAPNSSSRCCTFIASVVSSCWTLSNCIAGSSAAAIGLTRRSISLGNPIYYLDMVMMSKPAGRVLIEVRNDVAPRMAEKFRALILHERGFSYRGCSVFQAWGEESIITDDFQLHNGRGAYAALEYYTGLPAKRGAVGMRHGQKCRLVNSQFRMVLYERLPFAAIFGFVVDGIDVLDKIAGTSNPTGRSAMCTYIKNCGEYPRNGI